MSLCDDWSIDLTSVHVQTIHALILINKLVPPNVWNGAIWCILVEVRDNTTLDTKDDVPLSGLGVETNDINKKNGKPVVSKITCAVFPACGNLSKTGIAIPRWPYQILIHFIHIVVCATQ